MTPICFFSTSKIYPPCAMKTWTSPTTFRGKVGEVHHVHAHHGTDEYLEGGDPGAEYAFVKNTLPQVCRSGSRWDDDDMTTIALQKEQKATKKRLEGPTYWLRLVIYFTPILCKDRWFALKVVDYFGLVKCKKTSFQKIRGGAAHSHARIHRYKLIQRDSLGGHTVDGS